MTGGSDLTPACPAGGAAARRAAATGYAMLLPAGWRRIPVLHGTRKAITGIVDEVFSRLPAAPADEGLMRARLEVEHYLTEMARQARGQAVVDLYLPVEQVHGVAVPASIAVSRGTRGSSSALDWDEMMAQVAAGPHGARPVNVDGAEGVRLERSAGPGLARHVPCGSRLVSYVLPVPGVPGDWLIIAFSVVDAGGAAAAFARLLAEMFDAVMTTFRWTRSSKTS
jgi:hypothetical protein